ncbi:MAG TPA: Ig-like domain-containing protein, partial [Cytophagaceae bacterium]
RLRAENFGLTFHGYIDVPEDGKYTFYLTSDDGSRFYIGNEVVVNNDGIHSARERSGYIWLKKGKHIFTLAHFQKLGGLDLILSWEGPGISKQVVPAGVLYRLSPISECPENGTISVERWDGISGTQTSAIPVNTTPTSTFENPNFESKSDDGNNYGVRYRGYICPPYTGNYTFYIASDDYSELWLSTSGDPSEKVRIAYLSGAVNTRNWYKNASQKSASIYLKAGQKYYVEALHKEGGGEDHFAVAWKMPSGEFQAPIQGRHLSPFKNNKFPTVNITAPADNHGVIAGSNVTVTATAADQDGAVTKVEFYLDDVKMSEDNSSPYTWNWNSVQEGVYKLTARAFDDKGAVTVSSVVTVYALSYRDPENPALTKSALEYNYYEFSNEVSVLPDYASLTAKKSGTVSTFSIDVKDRNERYGIAYSGFINIPQDGIYTFYLASDDGSMLYFGDRETLLINNDGLHGMTPEKNAMIALRQGKHKIMVDLFQNLGGQGLTVSYSGPGITKQVIPASVLYRQIFSNNPPVVSLSSNSSTGISPASFTLTATATDSDGTVEKVEFYSNNVLIGTVSSSPFVFNWTNVAVGTYTIEARAYDDNEAMTVSNTVSLAVKLPNVVPSVTLSSNATTGTAPASFIFSATATDSDGTIERVEFYKNGELLYSDLDFPYEYNWQDVSAGNYSITAKAYDNEGGVGTSEAINITVGVPPNVPPTVSLSSNATSGVVPADFILTANATDSDGSVIKVEFYRNGQLLTTDFDYPYEHNWVDVAAGSYTITAKAYDDDDDYSTSDPVSIVVEAANVNPTVSLTSNTTTGIAPASFVFTATASDSDGSIKQVEFYQDDVLIGTITNSPYILNKADMPAGTYTIKAKAIDNKDGFDFSNEIIITVKEPNQLPTVTIISPEDESVFLSPATISIEVNASDPDGSIEKVVLYNGSVVLQELTTSPYTYIWTNVGTGTYTITARAYDNDGEYKNSSAVTISVEVPTSVKESDILVDNTIVVYPNPIYADANVVFEVTQPCVVKMVLTDMSGREVKVIQEKNYVPGHYTETFSFYDLADGDYLLNTTLNNQYFITKVRKGSKPKNVDKD